MRGNRVGDVGACLASMAAARAAALCPDNRRGWCADGIGVHLAAMPKRGSRMTTRLQERLIHFSICIMAALASSLACSAPVYTVSYVGNTANAEFPGFGGLPSNVLIEGGFSYVDGPSALPGSIGIYDVLSQEVKINGVAAIVRAGGATGPTASALQVGNNDATAFGFYSDYVVTFAFLDGSNSIGNGLELSIVSPRFFDKTGNVLGSPALPLSGAIYSGFPNVEILINYDESRFGGTTRYGNTIPISNWSFSIADSEAPIPEPGTLALLSVGLVGLAFIRRKQ